MINFTNDVQLFTSNMHATEKQFHPVFARDLSAYHAVIIAGTSMVQVFAVCTIVSQLTLL